MSFKLYKLYYRTYALQHIDIIINETSSTN